jgi:hypothetical protein
MIFGGKGLLTVLVWLSIFTSSLSEARKSRGIRSENFRDFTFFSENWGRNIKLQHGEYKEKDDPDDPRSRLYTTTKLVVLEYSDLDGGGDDEAVVALRTELNGSMPVAMDYYVFAYQYGRSVQLFHRWQEGPEGLCVRNRSLSITAALWDDPPVPHCCPKYTERQIYKWRGSKFVVISRRLWKNYPFQHPKSFDRLTTCR